MSEEARIRRLIAECVRAAEEDGDDTRLCITRHFRRRMVERGLFWADIVPILAQPDRVDVEGRDEHGRTKALVTGSVARVGSVTVICSVDWDTRLITLYWRD